MPISYRDPGTGSTGANGTSISKSFYGCASGDGNTTVLNTCCTGVGSVAVFQEGSYGCPFNDGAFPATANQSFVSCATEHGASAVCNFEGNMKHTGAGTAARMRWSGFTYLLLVGMVVGAVGS
ncbi:hypothetical protein C8J57DRAFT_1504002 [Mycena rebaudengoi]|nr:hypothetical protein C8J57DRAFT_1504002 [Mycena rebaudengoi]